MYPRYPGYTPRRDGGLGAYETVLARAGFAPVAGIDEAGRGACAGPLVIAAVVLDPASIRRMPTLADSKLLTPQVREEAYAQVLRWADDWHVVVIGADQIDATGLHVCNVAGMRRAYAGLRSKPGYVLTDGFPVRGLGAPALAVWKGDRVTASVAAASVLAKVSRDRMMRDLHERYPLYGFDRHKGYVTDEHVQALAEHGPSPVHRYSFVNVTRVAGLARPAVLDELDAARPEALEADQEMPAADPEALAADPETPAHPGDEDTASAMTSAAARAAGPAATAPALEMSPAGPAEENERRMDA
jgi:ribonuclease HII